MAPRASQDRPRCAQGLPRPSLFHLGASNGSPVCRFQKTCETRTPFFTFCFAVSFFLRLAVFVLSPQSAPRPQRSPQRAPGSSQGLPKGPPRSSPGAKCHSVSRVSCAYFDKEHPRAPKEHPRTPKEPQKTLCRTGELPRSSEEHLSKQFRRGLERS